MCDRTFANMTKMNEQIVDDIFGDFSQKKKIDYNIDFKNMNDDKFGNLENTNNNNVKEAPQNLKKDDYDINKIVESNIIIDKHSNDTIRLELRHVNGYKNGHDDNRQSIETSDFSIKSGDDVIDTRDGKVAETEFGNGEENRGNDVSKINAKFFFLL